MADVRSIPYNPSARAVGFFFSAGSVLGALHLFPWFRSPFWSAGAIALVGIAALLFLRRAVWKRVLIVSDDAFLVPSGFLRLRPRRLQLASIRRVWVTEIFGSAILRVRTTDRDIEIQDLYLPDRGVFQDLKRILDSSARTADPGQGTKQGPLTLERSN